MGQLRLFIFIFCLLLITPHTGVSGGAEDCIDQLPNGSINWTRGLIQAVGAGAPPTWAVGGPQERPLALSAARKVAQQHLFEVIRGIRIRSATRVGDIMAKDESITTQLESMIKNARLKNKKYMTDGTVEVTMEMDLYGGFAQLILPRDIKQVESIKTSVSVAAAPAIDAAGIFTGLIVDARGLHIKPEMNPKVLDENGMEVYGSAFVSREHAVQNGMCGYTINLDTAIADPRVADNPLIVKGLRTVAPESSDVVIGTADASKLRSASQNLSVLKQCRVIVIIAHK